MNGKRRGADGMQEMSVISLSHGFACAQDNIASVLLVCETVIYLRLF